MIGSKLPDIDRKISQMDAISTDASLTQVTRKRAAVAADLLQKIKKVQDSQT